MKVSLVEVNPLFLNQDFSEEIGIYINLNIVVIEAQKYLHKNTPIEIY
jgi:hypothetical protein